jgi:hypothetical protein
MEVTSVTSAAVLVDFAGRQAIIALQDGRWSAMNLRIEADRLYGTVKGGMGVATKGGGAEFYIRFSLFSFVFFPWVLLGF